MVRHNSLADKDRYTEEEIAIQYGYALSAFEAFVEKMKLAGLKPVEIDQWIGRFANEADINAVS